MGCLNCGDGKEELTIVDGPTPDDMRRTVKLINRLAPVGVGFDPTTDKVVIQVGTCPAPCYLEQAAMCQKFYMWVKHAFIRADHVQDPFESVRSPDGKVPVCLKIGV